MGQKVNPISLRLEKTNRHFDSCWYDDYNYTDLLLQDLKIKEYYKNVLNQINYPEGRILIENLPKKSNVHLFYHNPSNSRRKNLIRFQLQNTNYNKNNKKERLVDFFSFPEQKYWNDKKSATFTLAQQTLKEYQGWKNSSTAPSHSYKRNLQIDGEPLNQTELLQLKKPLFSLSSITQTKKRAVQKGIKKVEGTEKGKEYSKIKKILVSSFRTLLDNQRQGIQDSSLQLRRDGCASKVAHLPSSDLGSIPCDAELREKNGDSKGYVFFNPTTPCYKHRGRSDINSILLQYVINSGDFNNRVENQVNDKKWGYERFFVRYLLAHLYSKFLQNKSVCSKQSLQNLYQFIMFFQTKNNAQRKEHPIRGFESVCISQAKYGSPLREQRVEKESKGILTRNRYRTPKNEYKGYEVVPGLYSSNRVYKLHLESFLSKQYNTFFNLHFFRSGTEKQSAFFLVQEIIYYLERKMPFRRIKTQILREIPRYKHIKGIRITCSGRVGGRSKKAQRSKTQSVKIGQTPLGVFSSKIDFASKSALTRFGLVGVKVWVCYQ